MVLHTFLILQHGGRLSAAKRGQFGELSDAEVAAIAQAVAQARKREEWPPAGA